jgi:hypothetical protein
MDKQDLKKRLNTERQPELKMPTLYSKFSHQTAELDAISEKSIGEVVCPKTSQQSKGRNEEKRWLGQGIGRNPCRQDEMRNPCHRVRRSVIATRQSEHILQR